MPRECLGGYGRATPFCRGAIAEDAPAREWVGDRWPSPLEPATLRETEGESEMTRSIVCGVDGSADSQAALAVASDLAARLRLRLIMANVVEPATSPT